MQQIQQMAGGQQTLNSTGIDKAVDLYHAYKVAKNPGATLQEMMAQNPALAQIQQLKSGGADMKQTFYELCRKKGVDPQNILVRFN